MDIELQLASSQDARALLELQITLDHESTFMLLEPGEREPDHDRLCKRLADEADPSYTVIAMHGEKAAGYVSVGISSYARARATGHLVIGVAERYARRGLGRDLLQAAREQAVSRGLHRLELTVMEHNRRALGLYLSFGFQVEGLRRDVLEVADERVSEYYMGLLLTPST
ncbi:GNAT family N-acetyltransferase [Streptomyces sp. NPDC056682]|uniref:GNAT family N-acetyltransferase n=1 Tax=Streptomyces sp. NPDC056682 TaxID=3345909 RepID=UPI0036A68854